MRVTLLGTGEPRPHKARMPSATIIETPLGPWLVDCGDGAIWQMLRAGIAPQTVRHLIFTHLHADHTLGYMPFVMGGRLLGRATLQVWGPARVERMHQMYAEFYRGDGGADSGLDTVTRTVYEAGRVFESAALTVDTLPVQHSAETYALRFCAEGQTVVHSGDTAFHEPLIDFARNADILIHVAMSVSALRERFGERWNVLHSVMATPAEAGQVAHRAQVRKLVLVHLPVEADPADALRECRAEFDGEIVMGEDLLSMDIDNE